jgi:hypothetical protein
MFRINKTNSALKYLVITILSVSVLSTSAAGEDKPNNYFTDQDLRQYRKPAQPEDTDGSIEPDKKEAFKSTGSLFQKTRKYEVPYIAYEGMAGRIIVDVTFNGSETARMAIDTGSPVMVISNDLAERLGLLDEGASKIETVARGIGGAVPAILTIIDTVNIGGAEDDFIPTTITPSISTAFEGLIGMDFMSQYSMQVDSRRRVVIFEELKTTANMPAGHSELWWRKNFRMFASVRTQWKEFHNTASRQYRNQEGNSRSVSEVEVLEKMRDFADKQLRSADSLFQKLHNYAAEHAVPMHWRQY